VATLLKIKITTWLVIRERLPTGLYVYKCHIRLMSLCTFCGSHPESSTHIFLSCDFALRVMGEKYKILLVEFFLLIGE